MRMSGGRGGAEMLLIKNIKGGVMLAQKAFSSNISLLEFIIIIFSGPLCLMSVSLSGQEARLA